MARYWDSCGSRSKILNLKAIHNSGLLPEGREDGQRDELHLHRAQRLPGGDYNLPEAIRQAGDISPQATFIQENLRKIIEKFFVKNLENDI